MADSPDKHFAHIGERLRHARRQRDLRQADVASKIGVHINTVSRIEKTGRGDDNVIEQYARFLDVERSSKAERDAAKRPSTTIDEQLDRLKRGADDRSAVPVEVREFITMLATATTPEERDKLFEFARILDRLLP